MATTAPPRASGLGVTAIKGLGVVHPDAVDVTSTGVVGDRAFFFMVDAEDALRSAFRTGAWLGYTAAYDGSADLLTVTCPDGSRVAGEVRLGDALVADFYRYRKAAGRVVEGPWAELFSAGDVAGRRLRGRTGPESRAGRRGRAPVPHARRRLGNRAARGGRVAPGRIRVGDETGWDG